MFNVHVFLLLTIIAVIANIIAIPKLVKLANPTSRGHNRSILLLSTLTNSLLLSIGAAAVGSYMAPRVGLSSPFFESLVSLDQPHLKLLQLLPSASLNSIYALLGILLIQVFLVNRSFTLPEQFHPSICTRILKEGVLEEIIYRWCLMSLVARILFVEFSVEHDSAIFIAIVVSALGSAASHISDLYRYTFHRIDLAIISIVLVNFWGGIIYGWLLCQYGLATAILCHSIVIFISSISHDFLRFFAVSER